MFSVVPIDDDLFVVPLKVFIRKLEVAGTCFKHETSSQNGQNSENNRTRKAHVRA